MKKMVSLILVLLLIFVFFVSSGATSVRVGNYTITTTIQNNRSNSYHHIDGPINSYPTPDDAWIYFRFANSNVLYRKSVMSGATAGNNFWSNTCYPPSGYVIDSAYTNFQGVTVTA